MEIEVLKSLDHPCIIKYIDHIEEERYIILITELHGTEWDASNPELSAEKNPGLRVPENAKDRKEAKADAAGVSAPKLVAPAAEQKSQSTLVVTEKSVKRRTSCDLFECIGEL
jgi:hypothetical protein